MRRAARILGASFVALGILTLAWAIVVWRWQDPFTAAYTHWQQHRLAADLNRELARYRPPHPARAARQDLVAERDAVAADAAAFRREATVGQPIGWISIPRIGLHMVLVNGTDHDTLKRGPGRDLRSYMPGENRLVYVAGHRTTYLAPFSHIDAIRRGDRITLKMPYGTFVYRAVRHRVVAADDLSVLRSPRHALLELQACHPRFFATHRYIVYARLVRVEPRDGAPFDARVLAAVRG
ncbi:MAG TPA: class E sortase [Gaiellaceae bacterium]|nr:class E sortase [Gaiellaceae bacterium]